MGEGNRIALSESDRGKERACVCTYKDDRRGV